MKSFNDQWDIGLFSHLIQTILYCRFSRKASISQQISVMIDKLESGPADDRLNLNLGIEMASKLREGSDFKVHNVLKKHFLDHWKDKYCIYLEIFSLHNKSQQQYFSRLYDKNKLLQKWVFRKQKLSKTNLSPSLTTEKQSDLFIRVLSSIKEQLEQQEQENFKNEQIYHNTTASKSYQLVIKSKCCKKQKFVTHVFHHERNDSQPSIHPQYIRSSLLQLPRYWEKSLKFDLRVTVSVGCYFSQPFFNKANTKTQPYSDTVFFREPDRKLSSETKAEQKQKESITSLKLSQQEFSFRISGNKNLKHSSAELPIKKNMGLIFIQQRPRYQSIYESRDEEMNIFILSPRKLSEQQSPKVNTLQQKTIQFQITDVHFRGISEQVIEEFILQPDQNLSNVSSEGFQMLEDNDQLDSILEEKFLVQEETFNLRKKESIEQICILEKQIIELLNAIDNNSSLI